MLRALALPANPFDNGHFYLEGNVFDYKNNKPTFASHGKKTKSEWHEYFSDMARYHTAKCITERAVEFYKYYAQDKRFHKYLKTYRETLCEYICNSSVNIHARITSIPLEANNE